MVIVGLMSRHNTKTVCVVTVHCKPALLHGGLFSAVFVALTSWQATDVGYNSNSPISGELLTTPVAEYYFFSWQLKLEQVKWAKWVYGCAYLYDRSVEIKF